MQVREIFAEFTSELIGNGRAEKTLEFYRFGLEPFLEWLKDRPLDAKSIRAYKVVISSNGYKAGTVRGIC